MAKTTQSDQQLATFIVYSLAIATLLFALFAIGQTYEYSRKNDIVSLHKPVEYILLPQHGRAVYNGRVLLKTKGEQTYQSYRVDSCNLVIITSSERYGTFVVTHTDAPDTMILPPE